VSQCQSPRSVCYFSSSPNSPACPSAIGKHPRESAIGQPASVTPVPPAVPAVRRPAPDRPLVDCEPTDDGPQTDDAVETDFTDDVDVDTCPFARVVDVVTPFLSSSQKVLPQMLMIPSLILDGSAPRVMATVRATEFPVMLDSGAEVSVLPMELAEMFRPPVQLSDEVQEVQTFGPSNVVLSSPRSRRQTPPPEAAKL